MTRGATPNADERALIERAKALYLDEENPMTMEAIAASCGRSIGWILHISKRDGWPERQRVTSKTKAPEPLKVTAVDWKTYGDLALDVVLLRNNGHVIARYKGDFRLDNEVVSAAGVRQKASAIRALKAQAKPVASKHAAPAVARSKPAANPAPAAAPAPVTAPPVPEKPAKAPRPSDRPRAAMAAHALPASPFDRPKATLATLADAAANAVQSPEPDPLLARVEALERKLATRYEAIERRLASAEKALDLLLNLNRETFQTHAQRMAELDKELGRL